MFVTFQESPSLARGAHVHNGQTLTVECKSDDDLYRVGRYDVDGQWVSWVAHGEELVGYVEPKNWSG